MTRRAAQLAILLLMFAVCACASDTLDRVVATVNNVPVLQSELDEALMFEALQEAKQPDFSTARRREVLQHVIDRELVRQQFHDTYVPSAQIVDAQVLQIRTALSTSADDAQWAKLLWTYGFEPATLADYVRLQLGTMHSIESHLRPMVRVSHDEIEQYYRETLVPKVKAAGAQPDALDKVRSKIEELLLQQKINEIFNEWVSNLRNQAHIRVFDETLGTMELGTASATP